MLETIDLSKKIKKNDFKTLRKKLKRELYLLQRHIIGEKIPLIIILEGLESSGKGTVLSSLLDSMDPRYFAAFSLNEAGLDEKRRPFLWSFWLHTPAKGKIHIFNKSWYSRLLSMKHAKEISTKQWDDFISEINAFERTLSDNGTYILKLWLHVSKKEQKKRIQYLEKHASEAKKEIKEKYKENKSYKKIIKEVEDFLPKTNTASAPWQLISAENLNHASYQAMETILNAMEEWVGDTIREKIFKSNAINLNS